MHEAVSLWHSVHIKKKRAIMISLNKEKAFNSLEIPYLKTLLKNMEFETKFITAIEAIDMKPLAKLKINSIYSDNILIEPGSRHGCPLLPAQR